MCMYVCMYVCESECVCVCVVHIHTVYTYSILYNNTTMDIRYIYT